MCMPAISVIVPIYNSEKSIRKLLDGFLVQSLTDWELIAVNDGSTDASGKIIDEYASKDSRIIAVHKKNAGVSAARQTGTDMAQGKYIIHADSDDWVEPNMLQELYDKAVSSDADVVICDFYVNEGDRQTYSKQEPRSLTPQSVLRQLFENLHGSCCNKLVKRSCISEIGVNFLEKLDYCEDLIFWVRLLKSNNLKISYLPMAYYHYCCNRDSITNKYSINLYEQSRMMIDALERFYPDNVDKQIIISRQKLDVKFAAFSHPQFFSPQKYYDIYPEVNRFIMNRQSSFINNILFRLSCIKGCYHIAASLYILKNKVTGHTI